MEEQTINAEAEATFVEANNTTATETAEWNVPSGSEGEWNETESYTTEEVATPTPVETTVTDATVTPVNAVTIVEAPVVRISEVLSMLKRGYARTTKDKAYDPNVGTIAEHYGFTDAQMKDMFQHPKLKGKKTIKVKSERSSLVFIDDTESETTTEGDN